MPRISSFNLIPPSNWLFQDIGIVAGKAIIAKKYKEVNKSLKNAERQIEEFIRQWMIQQLIFAYGYPKDWIGELIVIEERVHIGSGRYRADIAVKNRSGDPIVLIETKSASCTATDLLHAEQQLKSYLSATHSALFGVVTNGHKTIFIKKRSNPNTFERISDLPILEEMLEEGIFSQTDIEVPPAPIPNDNGQGSDELIYPSTEEYVHAFKAIELYMTPNQRAMLMYHYYAPDQTVTMTELAKSVGYTSHRGGNLQYGKLGQLLCAELDWAEGIAISVLAWFTPPYDSPNRQWLLTLHPEVSEALKKLGWK